MYSYKDSNPLFIDALDELALMLDKDTGAIIETSKDKLLKRRESLLQNLSLSINKSNVFEVKILSILETTDINVIIPKLIINYIDKSIINEINKKYILSTLKNITPNIEGKFSTIVLNIFILEELSQSNDIPSMYKKILKDFLVGPKNLINNFILGKSLEEDLNLCLNDFLRITHISSPFIKCLIKNLTEYTTNLIVLILFGLFDKE